MRGNITRRGRASWRIKFDSEPGDDGKRRTRYVTVHGKRADAEAELARLLNEAKNGLLVDASTVTVGDWLKQWLDGKAPDLSPRTIEVYQEISRRIIPILGKVQLQKLKPAMVKSWISQTRISGGRNGAPISGRTARQAFDLLHSALDAAVKLEIISRNPAAAVDAPKADTEEVTILDQGSICSVLDALEGHRLLPIVALALATGLRRGELLALRWSDVDLKQGVLTVERSLTQTKAGGLQFKTPKTKNSRRKVALHGAVAMLHQHRRDQLELRMKLGLGRPAPDALVFCNDADGSPISPNYFSIMWSRFLEANQLPDVTFHSLRHTHASACIAAGMDVVKVSRRLGHANPNVTLGVYAHLFHSDDDDGAMIAVERMLKK